MGPLRGDAAGAPRPREPEVEQVMDTAGLNLEPKPYYLYLPGA